MRFEKHFLFRHIGQDGQKLLSQKSAAIIGIGALGSVSSDMLARAGIGKLILCDSDIVELSNLQRQTLYSEEDIGKLKVECAKNRLKKINNNVEIEAKALRINNINIAEINADLIIDGTDNLETRFLINDYCKKNNIPWIMGAIAGSKGFVLPIIETEQPCFRCIFEHVLPAATCNNEGVIGPIVHTIASLQVTLTLKFFLGKEINQTLTIADIWENVNTQIKVKHDPTCLACQGKYDFLEGRFSNGKSYEIEFCETKNAFRVVPHKSYQLNLSKIKELLEEVKFHNDLVLKGNYEGTKLKIHSYGEIIFLSEADENKRNKIAEKLSEIRK